MIIRIATVLLGAAIGVVILSARADELVTRHGSTILSNECVE